MALKHKVTEAEFKKLSKDIQAEYTREGDEGDYTLDVDGLEDTGALKRAKEHENAKRKEAEKLAKEAKERLEALTTEMEELRAEKIRSGDKVTEAEKKLQAKHDKAVAELQKEIDGTRRALQEQMVDSVARGLAAELAGDNAEILMPHITRRLKGEFKEGKASTVVLGPDGTESALTVDDLKKEVLSSGKFSAVVVASKGSGSGATGSRKGAGGPGPKKLSEMNATEEAAFVRANPVEYKKMLDAEKPV